MTTHTSILAWRIPWTEEPGGLQSMGSQRAGHDWSEIAWQKMRKQSYLSQRVVMKFKWLNRCAGKNAEHMAYTNKQKFFMEVELGYSVWPNIKAYIWQSLAQVFWLIFRKGVSFLASYGDRSLNEWLDNGWTQRLNQGDPIHGLGRIPYLCV